MSALGTTTTELAARGPLARALDGLRARLGGSGDRASDGRNAILAFGVRIASAGILFLSQILLARWMGASEYGRYVYAWTLVLVLGALSTAGLNIAAIRIVSELRERCDEARLRGFLRSSRLLIALTGSIVAVLAVSMTLSGGKAVSLATYTSHWSALALVLLAIPAYALTDLQDGISRGWARIATALVAPYLVRPVLILAIVASLVIAGFDLTAEHAAMAAVAATWLAWLVQSVLVARDQRRLVPAGERTYDASSWARTATPLWVMGAFDLAMQNIDVIAIANLLSPAEAGIYFAAAKTMGLILFVHYAVGSALANRFAAIATRGDKDAMRSSIRDGVRWTFWPSLMLTVLMLMAGPWLLTLFGPRFADAYPVMVILGAAILARSAIGPAETLLNMTGGERDCARALMVAALTNLGLCLLLIPAFGILGAAVAVATAIVTGAVLNWRAARRNLGIDIAIWAGDRQSVPRAA